MTFHLKPMKYTCFVVSHWNKLYTYKYLFRPNFKQGHISFSALVDCTPLNESGSHVFSSSLSYPLQPHRLVNLHLWGGSGRPKCIENGGGVNLSGLLATSSSGAQLPPHTHHPDNLNAPFSSLFMTCLCGGASECGRGAAGGKGKSFLIYA